MKMIKKLLLLISLIGILFILNTTVEAAGVSIKTSKSTVKPGESFKVTISVSNGAGYVSASVSNGSGGFGSTWLENGSKSFTCKAGSSGNVTIKTSGTVADFSTEKDESASRSKSVKIQAQTTTKKDTDKKTTTKKEEDKKEEKKEEVQETVQQEESYSLKSLEIEGVELLPEFKSDVLQYTVKVADKDKLDINAIANSSNTIVNITGNENLQLGENTISITLKGQDDKEMVSYQINVIKEKSELVVAKEKIQKLEKEKRILIGTNIILVVLTVGGISTAIIKMKKYKKYDKE